MFEIEIINFQSIAHARLSIRGFTCLTGPSNRGKSSVIRALRAIAYNELHPSFIRSGAKETALRLHFPESSEHDIALVEFRKSTTVNQYTLTLKDGTVKTYPKIGTATPEELHRIGFTLLTTERDDLFNLNFQGQLEPLFLVADTPTTLTSFINRIFAISPYEKALRTMSRDIITYGRDYDTTSQSLTLKIRHAEDLFTEIQSLQLRRDNLFVALETISATEARHQKVVNAISEWQKSLQETQKLDISRDRVSTFKVLHNRVIEIASRLEIVSKAVRVWDQHQSLVNQLSSAKSTLEPLPTFIQQISSTLGNLTVFSSLKSFHTNLEQQTQRLNRATASLSPLPTFILHLSKIGGLVTSFSSVKSYYCNLILLNDHLKSSQGRIVPLADAKKLILVVSSALESFNTLRPHLLSLKTFTQLYEEDQQKIQVVEMATKEMSELHSYVHSAISVCPLCQHTLGASA